MYGKIENTPTKAKYVNRPTQNNLNPRIIRLLPKICRPKPSLTNLIAHTNLLSKTHKSNPRKKIQKTIKHLAHLTKLTKPPPPP